jgi:hypothetical protein
VEDIHDSLVSLELALVPLRLRHARSLDVRIESVQIEPNVDAGVGEGLHAAVVVSAGIDVVDADGVGSEGLHQVGIAGALVVVDERVVRQELVGDAFWRRLVESMTDAEENSKPLRKNWLPSLVKNLAPFAVMVGMACAMLARRPRRRKSSMCTGGRVSRQSKWMCEKQWQLVREQ